MLASSNKICIMIKIMYDDAMTRVEISEFSVYFVIYKVNKSKKYKVNLHLISVCLLLHVLICGVLSKVIQVVYIVQGLRLTSIILLPSLTKALA